MKPLPDITVAASACWLMHLVVGLHQPLHAVAFSGPPSPNGDKGGNVYIRAKRGRRGYQLHQLWDGLLGNAQTYRATGNLAIELRRRPEFAREQLAELSAGDVKAWSDESLKIARDVAYASGTLKGGNDRGGGPVLPDGYTKQAKAVAERRVVLAGYRLADTLRVAVGAAATR
jgi:hypothetical protein